MNPAVHNSSSDEEVPSTTAQAVMRALEKQDKDTGVANSPPDVANLQAGLRKLQEDIGKWAVRPTTSEEVKRYDRGLQEIACQAVLKVAQAKAFLNSVKKAGLEDDPAVAAQVETVEQDLANVTNNPALARYIGQCESFLALKEVRSFTALRQALDPITGEKQDQPAVKKQQKPVFRARRDPSRSLFSVRKTEEGEIYVPHIIIWDNGTEFVYMPDEASLIGFRMWRFVYEAFLRSQEAAAIRHAEFDEKLEVFKAPARRTPGLTPYKGVHEQAEGYLFLSVIYPVKRRVLDETGKPAFDKDGKPVHEEIGKTGKARLLILIGRGNFTVGEIFEPDQERSHFILDQSRYPDGNYRWFPLDPRKFDPGRAPSAIAEIVWPPLYRWYNDGYYYNQSRAILDQREDLQEQGLLVTVTEGDDNGAVGYSIFHIKNARTATRGPAELTCKVEWQEEVLFLREYVSWVPSREQQRSRGPIELDDIVDQPIPRQPAEDEKAVNIVFRHFLNQRKEYEAWKASQGEEISEEEALKEEEGENGPPSTENNS